MAHHLHARELNKVASQPEKMFCMTAFIKYSFLHGWIYWDIWDYIRQWLCLCIYWTRAKEAGSSSCKMRKKHSCKQTLLLVQRGKSKEDSTTKHWQLPASHHVHIAFILEFTKFRPLKCRNIGDYIRYIYFVYSCCETSSIMAPVLRQLRTKNSQPAILWEIERLPGWSYA